MCLFLDEKAKKLKAESDIICYKILKPNKICSFVEHGDNFTGIINNQNCVGKISIYKKGIYFCTNNKELDGGGCPIKFEFEFSWVFDERETSIVVNGEEKIIDGFKTVFRDFGVEMGKSYNSDLVRKPYSSNSVREFDMVEEGFHSYRYLKDAIQSTYDYSIAECIIPKGAIYYLGKFTERDSYASSELKYIKIIRT